MATTTAPLISIAPRTLRSRALGAGVILAVFTAYTVWVVAGHGLLGFVSLAGHEPWAMQLLLDLVIACAFGIGWMVRDARQHHIAAWPFVVGTLLAGSIGLLGYVVWRGWKASEPTGLARRA